MSHIFSEFCIQICYIQKTIQMQVKHYYMIEVEYIYMAVILKAMTVLWAVWPGTQ